MAGAVGGSVGWRNSLGIYAVRFFREDLTKCRRRWLETTCQRMQNVRRVAWHCRTNAASMGGRRANLFFLLLVGCNAKKKPSSVLTLAGSVSQQYVDSGLTLSLREAARSWGIPVAV